MSAEQDLIQRALEAGRNSYSPYSNFKVGAAVQTAGGKSYAATNMESSSYGLTVCAERNALAAAIAAGERKFDKMVVTSRNGVAPCGACRQVIWDICGDIEIILADEDGREKSRMQSRDLLPRAFSSEDLHK